MPHLRLVSCLVVSLSLVSVNAFTWSYGGIIRANETAKQLSLVFTGGSFSEGGPIILDALKSRGIRASFFVTGDYLRTPEFKPQLLRMIGEGHYLGPHSDSHPLYCDWDDRNLTLVTRDFFAEDLHKNLQDLTGLGPKRPMRWFIPPYEWYNFDISAWSTTLAPSPLRLFCFTPGTLSHTDYAPEGDRAFHPSIDIFNSVLDYEKSHDRGLNGFLLLMHLGSGPGRLDKFAPLIPALLDRLLQLNYTFALVDTVLPPV